MSATIGARPLVIGHRTCPRDATENTISGIEFARQVGCDVVEVDVRRSSDGVALLHHDRWLLRMAKRPLRLEWVTAEKAQQYRLPNAERIPTLAEGLAALGPDLRVAIDVKDAGAGDVVASEVINQDKHDQVLLWSKYEPVIRVAARRLPDVEIALLRDTRNADESARLLADTKAFGARAISAHWSQVGNELADRCRDNGLSLYAWCRSPEIDAEKLHLLDGVVTDWPREALAAREALHSP